MEEKEAAYKWFIPSIHDLLHKSSKVDEITVTIDSAFQVRLNFTKKDSDELNLYLLPLISIREFKFSLYVWLNASCTIEEKSEKTVVCVAPREWIHCRKICYIKNTISNYGGTGSGLNIELIFRYKIKITDPIISDSLQDDLDQLFTSGNFHDAVIKTNDGKEFKVHKLILATRCEVLNAAFKHETVESATNIVESPFDGDTMNNLLLFLYSRKTPNIDTIAEKLLVAADYYQLNELKNKCGEILKQQLSVENAVDRLAFAKALSCTILEQGVFDFFDKNHTSEIMQSDGWRRNTNVDILKTICEHITRRYVSNK